MIRNDMKNMVMRCFLQVLRSLETAEKGRKAFDISTFSLISCNFQMHELLTDVFVHHGSYLTFDQHTMNFSIGVSDKPLNF